MTLEPDRRASLLSAKLAALVKARWGGADVGGPVPEREAGRFPGGATLAESAQSGRSGASAEWPPAVGWVLVDERPERALGPAMAWARQNRIDEVHLLVEHAAGMLARRAEAFRHPASVWQIHGAELVGAVPEPVEPAPAPPVEVADAAALLREHGLEVVVRGGEVSGEVLGLEVARVVRDPAGGARIEVGVGRHDREAFAMLHAGLPTTDALRSVIDTVGAQRRPGAPPHPLNRLASERWLRCRLVAEPSLAGAVELFPVETHLPWTSVQQSGPAGAVGVDEAGEPVVVVASTGIDLDLVPTAADVRIAYAPQARLVLVVPERDAHAVTRALAAALAEPAEVIAIEGDWRG